MEQTTASGLILDTRSAEGSVAPEAVSGEVMPGLRVPPPTRWAGWPAEWGVPNWWGRVFMLTDLAWTCLDSNASILSTMPPYLVNAAPSLNADWLNNPNPDLYSCWEEFAKQLMWDYQCAGEAFVLADAYYSTGWPARFHVVPPWTVNAEIGGDGLRTYSIGSADVTADMLHIRYTSSVDDARGHGPLEAAGPRLVAAEVLSRYATELARYGGPPSAVLTHPGNLTAQQAYDLQTQWIEARMASLGMPAVLSGGVTYNPLSLSPKDMALVELAQWNEARIAVLLGVPPFCVGLPSGGDSLTYSNVTSLFDYRWRAGLRPMAVPVMSSLSQWALPRGTTVEVNRDEFVKPDLYTRAQTWQILIAAGVLTPEEVREMERYSVSAPSEILTAGVLQ